MFGKRERLQIAASLALTVAGSSIGEVFIRQSFDNSKMLLAEPTYASQERYQVIAHEVHVAEDLLIPHVIFDSSRNPIGKTPIYPASANDALFFASEFLGEAGEDVNAARLLDVAIKLPYEPTINPLAQSTEETEKYNSIVQELKAIEEHAARKAQDMKENQPQKIRDLIAKRDKSWNRALGSFAVGIFGFTWLSYLRHKKEE